MVRADDKALVQLARQGKSDAYRILAARYHRVLHGLLTAQLGDPAWAQDVARAAFAQAQEKLHTLRKPENFWPWLLDIALKLKRIASPDKSNIAQVEIAIASGSDGEVAAVVDADSSQSRRILDAISQLPQTSREALLLHLMEGENYESIADSMNMPLSAIRSQVSRAKASLLRQLQGDTTL